MTDHLDNHEDDHCFVNAGFKAVLELQVPVPGHGYKIHRIPVAQSPDVCKAIADIRGATSGDSEVELGEDTESALIELGILLNRSNAKPRFACPINTLSELHSLHLDDVIDQCWLQTNRQPPSDLELQLDLPKQLSSSRTLLWLISATTKQIHVYWLNPALEAHFAEVNGRNRPFVIEQDHVASVSQTYSEQASTKLQGKAAKALEQQGYFIFKQLFNPSLTSACQQYFSQLLAGGHHNNTDRFVPDRYSIHREPVADFLHALLTPLTSHILGHIVHKSYSFLASYHANASLGKHTDRDQCEWNWSIQLASDSEDGRPWPIYIEHQGIEKRVELACGDGVLFSGKHNPHWREPLQNSERETLLLLHFVPEGFSGSLD